MPDRLDLPTPFNGGLIVALVLLALVALIAWAAYTARHTPWRCEVCGHPSDTLAELIVHDERHGDPMHDLFAPRGRSAKPKKPKGVAPKTKPKKPMAGAKVIEADRESESAVAA